MNRRDVLTGALKLGAGVSIGAPFVIRAQAASTITVVNFGGSWGEFVKESWIKPFTAETGISVLTVAGPDLAKVKAQVTNDAVEWDVFEGVGSMVYAGGKEGLWEPIDPKIVDPGRFFRKPPAFAVPLGLFGEGIAYDPSRTKHPARDFSQLWDVQKFPGRRGFRNRAGGTLEIALLADGVSPSELYPLDVDRAFKVLDRIKPQVKQWIAETSQSINLIQTNELDYTIAPTNRVRSAQESGVSIEFSFDQCVRGTEYFCVLKGSKRKEAAMRFCEFVTRAPQQATMTVKTSIAPSIKEYEKLDEKVQRWIPDSNNPRNVITDDEYWADHFVELDKRFKEWILT